MSVHVRAISVGVRTGNWGLALRRLGCATLLLSVASSASSCKKCSSDKGSRAPFEQETHVSAATGPTSVWCVDDSVRVGREPGAWFRVRNSAGMVREGNGVLDLVALPGETVAWQVVLQAGSGQFEQGRVRIEQLKGPSGTVLRSTAREGVNFADIQRFVVYDVPMPRRSGGRHEGESLGWQAGAMPRDPSLGARSVADALLPIDYAERWNEYPLHANAGEARVVWVEVTVPEDAPAGEYRGQVQVSFADKAGTGTVRRRSASFPVRLRVGTHRLPYNAVKTMVYLEPDAEVRDRTGSEKAVEHAFQVLHRHHLSPIFDITRPRDVVRYRHVLDGTLYTETRGYAGPGKRLGVDVVSIGAYGILGDPTPQALDRVAGVLEVLGRIGIEDQPGQRDVFLYAVDEQCDSPRGPKWRASLRGSSNPMLQRLRVGHTCSDPPADQPVDIPIVFASEYDTELAAKATAAGKHVWIYNGVVPRTGSFLTDSWALSLRANAWIQARYGIERWFYWEVTFWNDSNRGGLGPHDPFLTTETFHNQDQDHCNGDGLLLYPGKQVRNKGKSLGFDGVVASIRLKQWRRGIEDAGYIRLASRVDPGRVTKLVDSLVGATLQYTKGTRPPWAGQGKKFYAARQEMFRMIEGASGAR